MLKKVGDITWHYHAGINTFVMQTAVRYKTPLVVWGEHGMALMFGMYNFDDDVEFIQKLKIIGVEFPLDRFGIGLSS